MNAKETQAQTIKDEELELTKDYYAHHLTRSYYSPTGFAKMWDSNTGNDRSVRSCFGAAQLLLIFIKEKRKK